MDSTLPNFTRAQAIAVLPDLLLMHDLLAGTRVMHEKSNTYITRWPDEQQNVYDFRRKIETLFSGLDRTLSAATGMLFAKPPSITWNASEVAMTEQWANIDNAGTAGPVLVKRFAEASLRDGIGAILVDHPPTPKDMEITGQTEQDLGLRPTWAIYGRAQVINWRTATVNNRRVLTLAVLHETAEVVDGPFGIKPVHRWRVLELVQKDGAYQATWTLWESDTADTQKKEDFRNVGTGVFTNRKGIAATTIPLALAYTGRTDSPLAASIPLLGVAWANLAHWQQSTDLRFYRALAAYPQPVIIGEIPNDPVTNLPGKVKMGPGTIVNPKGQGAAFSWAELKGTSMDQLEKGILEKLRQMSMLGMAFISSEKRVAETAESKRITATAENSTLATAAQGIEDAINTALEFHAWYLGIEKVDAPVLTINRDYESTVLDSATMTAWVLACEKVGMPLRMLLEAWQDGGRIGPDEDLDAIEAEATANALAAQQQKEQAAKDALALQQENQPAA